MASVLVVDRLGPGEISAVSGVVERASLEDGTAPLSEHVLLHLAHGGDQQARNLLLLEADRIVGYAHLDVTDTVSGPSAELVVDPAHRGHGLGAQLVAEVTREAGEPRLRLWAHGQHPAATALAARHGFQRTRALWQMRRSLYAPLPAAVYPEDVSVRTFRSGEDEDAWVEVNGRAFADLPDQGRWQVADLKMREGEPWFEPAGFFLAEQAGRLVGFHWTKVHGGGAGTHSHPPIGEVYVVGVDPGAQGSGLGTALTLTGLAHLRARGLGSAMLYVDEGNTAAIRVYTRLGFSHWDTDVTFQRH
ncbi:MAG: mycothiol synthase [Mycobacteriales bacterium]